MLTRLTVSNYAIIDNLTVEFHGKLNSVTGETGAGKSVILGALGLILGSRADLSILKDTSKKCIVEGVFNIGEYSLEGFFKENDIDFAPETILRREITSAGNSRAFINDTPVNLKVLRDLGLYLIDIHSQHQNLELGSRKFQLDLVDAVAGTSEILRQYKTNYFTYKSLQKELAELVEKSDKEKAELDYFEFQFQQLHEARLEEHEQEELETQLAQLTHAEDIRNALSSVRELIENDRLSILKNLKDSIKFLEKISNYMQEAGEIARRTESVFIEIKDILAETEQISEGIEYDPGKIESYTQRLNLIYNLEQKHHVKSVGELIALRNSFEEKINLVTGYDDEIVALTSKVEDSRIELAEVAAELTVMRKNVFRYIESEILADLKQLGMPRAKLEVKHELLPDFTANGTDMVSILFSANADINADEISKVASGGEMSRLMLAIKNLYRRSKALPTVIFDEIDAGVSGEIAMKMGNIIKSFSGSAQIINITHLPQIAAKGDIHFVVYKYDEAGKTLVTIKELNRDERLVELAKMVGGDDYSEATLKTARELLTNG